MSKGSRAYPSYSTLQPQTLNRVLGNLWTNETNFRPDWQQDAACRGLLPEQAKLFLADPHTKKARRAADFCHESGCLVFDTCLKTGLEDLTLVGVMGGMTQKQRQQLVNGETAEAS